MFRTCAVPDLTEKYEMMTRAGRSTAPSMVPATCPRRTSTQISTTELNIRNVAQDDLDELGAEQRRRIDDEHAAIMTRVPEIPFVVKRSPGEFQVDAELIVQQGADELVGGLQCEAREGEQLPSVQGLSRPPARRGAGALAVRSMGLYRR